MKSFKVTIKTGVEVICRIVESASSSDAGDDSREEFDLPVGVTVLPC